MRALALVAFWLLTPQAAYVPAPPAAQAPVRVACLGDSITVGARLPDREHLSYPAQLGERLGAGFEVRNLGVGGATLLAQGDKPYVATAEWTAALAWHPDIAVVILGTNDTVLGTRENWTHEAELEHDARALVAALQGAGAERVLLCTPPPLCPDAPGLADERRAELAERAPRLARIRAALAAVARDGVELHDLARVFGPERTVDGAHPDPFGAELLADRIAEILARPAAEPLDLAQRRRAIDGEIAEVGAWHGFAMLDFALVGEDVRCTVITPHVGVPPGGAAPRAGRPWILRASIARFDPALDLALLDRGFHVVACPGVAPRMDPGGAMAERERWDRLLPLLTSLGLGRRPLVAVPGPDGRTWLAPYEARTRRAHPSPPDPPELSLGPAAPPELRAVLAAAGMERNPATLAHPSAEYRAGAGWGERTWHGEVAAMRALCAEPPELRVAFLGDSITQGLTGTADRRSHAGGARAFDRVPGAVSLGLSGDRTEHLLWRIEHGALAVFDPEVIVLQIGVNNVNAAGHTAAETAAGIAAVVASLRAHEPQADVLVCGPFPAHGAEDPVRRALDEVHARITALDALEHVRVLDLRGLFTGPDGALSERMRPDGVHVSEAGQSAWIEALAPLFDEKR